MRVTIVKRPIKRHRNPQSESKLKRAILVYLNLRGYVAFPIRTGGTWDEKNRGYIPNQQQTGIADILGIIPPSKSGEKFGIPLAIEVKSKSGKLSEYQVEFRAMWEVGGGVYCCAYSLDDVIELFDKVVKGGVR